MPLFQRKSATLELAAKKTPVQHPYIDEESAIETAIVQLRDAEAERARLSSELAEAERAATAQRQRLEFLQTPPGLASTSDQEYRAAAQKLVDLEKERYQAEQALARFDGEQGNFAQRHVALQERRKQLDRKILEWEWKRDWLELLPRLEADLIELVRLEELKHREQLRLAGVLPTVLGILVSPKADSSPTTAKDIRKVLEFQRSLFAGDVPVMARGNVVPSSLHLSWWRGF